MITWNPWHGCHRVSEGCEHCYMYALDRRRGVDTSVVRRTEGFNMPLQRDRFGHYTLAPGSEVMVGLSTDFFVEEADRWRQAAWAVMRRRSDVVFHLLTKRAHRLHTCLPPDWGQGYANVMLSVTAENQRTADLRLPLLLSIPARHRGVMVAPCIGSVSLDTYLATGLLDHVTCDGERYDGARPCHYEWVKSLSDQCRYHGVSFSFYGTGTLFVKDGRTYHIASHTEQRRQAQRSGLSYEGRRVRFDLRPAEGDLFAAL